MTNYGATGDDKIVIMITLSFMRYLPTVDMAWGHFTILYISDLVWIPSNWPKFHLNYI